MQNRRTFLKMGVAGSAFLPVFAELSAKAEQKDATVKRKNESRNAKSLSSRMTGGMLVVLMSVSFISRMRSRENIPK